MGYPQVMHSEFENLILVQANGGGLHRGLTEPCEIIEPPAMGLLASRNSISGRFA